MASKGIPGHIIINGTKRPNITISGHLPDMDVGNYVARVEDHWPIM